MNIARGLFVPKGYPDSVAPEYAHYQLWDTVQQTTYFINTVISKRAIMVLTQPQCSLLVRQGHQYTPLISLQKYASVFATPCAPFRTPSPPHKPLAHPTSCLTNSPRLRSAALSLICREGDRL